MPYKNPEDRRIAARRWYANNPGKVKVYAQKKRQSGQLREQSRRWREKNLDAARAHSRKSYRRHHEKRLDRMRQRYHEDIDKSRQKNRRYRRNNPEKARSGWERWRKRNPDWFCNEHISAMQFYALLDAQKNRCGICGDDFSTMPRRRIHVDHCHTTGEVRGLLCHFCNFAIGAFRDDPKRMRSAIRWVTRDGLRPGLISKRWIRFASKGLDEQRRMGRTTHTEKA